MKKEYNNSIAYFNILRFIGAISIAVLGHYAGELVIPLGFEDPFIKNEAMFYISRNSYMFVEMFFMISGILFSFYYFKKIIDGMKLKDFIANRWIRIFPILIITTIFMYIANLILYSTKGELWKSGTLSLCELFINITLGGKALLGADNTLNAPIWYISVLMICYFIAFFLARIYKKKRLKYLFVIPIIVGIMLRYSKYNILFLNESVARGLISFYIGVLLGEFFKNYKNIKRKNIIVLKILSISELCIFVFLLLLKDRAVYINDNIFCYNSFFFPELLILLYDEKWINNICKTKFFKYLGNISYGIYMWNFPILISFYILYRFNIMNISVTSIEFIGLNFAVHITFATFSYYFLEKRCTKHLKEIKTIYLNNNNKILERKLQ